MLPEEVHYVCAFWEGPRRYVKGSPIYLPYQLKALSEIEHNLTHIWFVFNGERTSTIEIPTHLRDTPVSVIYRKNIGLSYGALSDIHAMGVTEGYYLFIEDDNVPALDNFDQRLLDLMTPECGWLCTLIADSGFGRHAGIATGLLRAACLDWIAMKSPTGRVQYSMTSDHYDAHAGQVGLSRAVLDTGYTIEDTSAHYRASFWDNRGVTEHAPQNTEALFLPVQALDVQSYRESLSEI